MDRTATIAVEDPDQPEILDLLTESDAYHAALYPAESNHPIYIEELRGPEVCFLVARIAGRAVGTACFVAKVPGWAEIKRLYLSDAARGQRLGRRLLERLESEARGRGLGLLRLETGPSQPEALGLYRAFGYAPRGPFGDYRPDPLSLFFEKTL